MVENPVCCLFKLIQPLPLPEPDKWISEAGSSLHCLRLCKLKKGCDSQFGSIETAVEFPKQALQEPPYNLANRIKFIDQNTTSSFCNKKSAILLVTVCRWTQAICLQKTSNYPVIVLAIKTGLSIKVLPAVIVRVQLLPISAEELDLFLDHWNRKQPTHSLHTNRM